MGSLTLCAIPARFSAAMTMWGTISIWCSAACRERHSVLNETGIIGKKVQAAAQIWA